MKQFILLIQFLTRIPINLELEVNREDFAKAIRYFPFVGLIIGIINVIIFYLASLVLPFRIAVIIAVVTQIFLTGGIHLDGLSDTFDGLLSGRSRERILEIMKDSRIGTFGLLSLLIWFILKFELLASLSYAQVMIGIFLGPIVARGLVVISMYNKPYARESEGLGDLFIGKATRSQYISNIMIISLMVLVLVGTKAIIIIPILTMFIYLFNKWVIKNINGITGDILGAEIEILDLVFIICILALKGNFIWNFI